MIEYANGGTPRLRTECRVMAVELKAWRATLGLTPQGAADKLGVPLQALVDWEAGVPVPFPAMIESAIGAPLGRMLRQ